MADLVCDTSAEVVLLALRTSSGTLLFRTSNSAAEASRTLLPSIEDLLSEAGLHRRDLKRLGCCVGPGRFTGLRLGLSVMQALALGLQIPLWPLLKPFIWGWNILLSEDPAILHAAQQIWVLDDARMGQVYATRIACREGAVQLQTEPHLISVEEAQSLQEAGDSLCVGSWVSPVLAPHPQASMAALDAAIAKEPKPAQPLVPCYVRDRVAQTLEERWAGRKLPKVL